MNIIDCYVFISEEHDYITRLKLKAKVTSANTAQTIQRVSRNLK